MEDRELIALYWARDEQAITQAQTKYGSYCSAIAKNILADRRDREECLWDTWFRAWNAIPPNHPQHLSAFLGKITRNLALNRLVKDGAQKRGRGQAVLAMAELEECIPAPGEDAAESTALGELLELFLLGLPEQSRKIFLQRYWYFCSVREIARECSLTESGVKMKLLRTRRELKNCLEREGISL